MGAPVINTEKIKKVSEMIKTPMKSKKKWSKGTFAERATKSLCLMRPDSYDNSLRELRAIKLITETSISIQLQIYVPLAKRIIEDLLNKNMIVTVLNHKKLAIFMGNLRKQSD